MSARLLINNTRPVAARLLTTDQLATANLDAYMTPSVVARALIRIEGDRLPQTVWCPGAGTGNIVLPLRDSGRAVFTSDIFDYGVLPDCKIEAYETAAPPAGIGGIVEDPPFRPALRWAQKAISEVPYVAFPVRLLWLESLTRLPFFRAHPPARIWVSSRRFSMHQFGYTGKKAASNVPYAWVIWDAAAEQKQRIDWFDYKTEDDWRAP